MEQLDELEAEISRAQDEEEGVAIDLIAAAFALFLASTSADLLASSLDDSDSDHIRRQLTTILDLDDIGLPRSLDLSQLEARFDTFARNIADKASAMAGHSLSPDDRRTLSAMSESVLRQFRGDTAQAITRAIETALSSAGSVFDRAYQLKRSLGLSIGQQAALEAMQNALLTFARAPRKLTPARTGSDGTRIPPSYARTIDRRALLATTNGKLSAAQQRLIQSALSNPALTPDDANALLDRHANALRRHRIRATVANGVHGLTETVKVAVWTVAQRAGTLPSNQRRYWRTAGDERVRHAHAAVPRMNPAGVALSEPFKTPLGERMAPPLEWGCRCRTTLRSAN